MTTWFLCLSTCRIGGGEPKARRSWNRQFRNIGKVLVRALKEELFRKSEGDRDWSTIVYKRKSM